MSKLYAQREIEDMGVFYTQHVDHMTSEGLHEKSEIAAELGFRDQRIAALESEIASAYDGMMVRQNKMVALETELANAKQSCIKGRCGGCHYFTLRSTWGSRCWKRGIPKDADGYCDEFEPPKTTAIPEMTHPHKL
jgi:hypothetical protein